LSVPKLDILPASKLAFIGASGSGKSTLLELLAMILQPTSCGEFRFNPDSQTEGHDIKAVWQSADPDRLSELRSHYIGYVLQTGGLLPYLSVRENINLSRRLLQLPTDNVPERLAEKLGIVDQLDKLPAKLSVGQLQRAAIARALAHAPSVVIADEPTAAIDPVNAENIVALLVNLADELGVTLILATHAQDLARRLGFTLIMHKITAVDEHNTVVTVSSADAN